MSEYKLNDLVLFWKPVSEREYEIYLKLNPDKAPKNTFQSSGFYQPPTIEATGRVACIIKTTREYITSTNICIEYLVAEQLEEITEEQFHMDDFELIRATIIKSIL